MLWYSACQNYNTASQGAHPLPTIWPGQLQRSPGHARCYCYPWNHHRGQPGHVTLLRRYYIDNPNSMEHPWMVSLAPEDDGERSQWLPTHLWAEDCFFVRMNTTCPWQPEDCSEDPANRKDFSGPKVFERRTVRHEPLQHKQNADPRVHHMKQIAICSHAEDMEQPHGAATIRRWALPAQVSWVMASTSQNYEFGPKTLVKVPIFPRWKDGVHYCIYKYLYMFIYLYIHFFSGAWLIYIYNIFIHEKESWAISTW